MHNQSTAVIVIFLAKFNVDKTLMKLLYSAYVESIITFLIICWFW